MPTFVATSMATPVSLTPSNAACSELTARPQELSVGLSGAESHWWRHSVNGLLSRVLDAHGGLARWNSLQRIRATIVTAGDLWSMKGLAHDPAPCRVEVWLHEQRVMLEPSGGSDLHSEYAPDRVAILDKQGAVIVARDSPRTSFASHVKLTRWDPLQLAYFDGCALWTYINTPFLLAGAGVELTELEPWSEGGETLRVLRGRFPHSIATHSPIQDFFFGDDCLLRRQDCQIDIAGGMNAAYLGQKAHPCKNAR